MAELRSRQLEEANKLLESLQSEVTQLKRKHRKELEQLKDKIKRIKREHKQELADAEQKAVDAENQAGAVLKQMVLTLAF